MEKGKIIVIGLLGCHLDRVFSEMKQKEMVTIQRPMGRGKTETTSKPVDLINVDSKIDWEGIKHIRFKTEFPMTASEYRNLVYNEPKSKFHK